MLCSKFSLFHFFTLLKLNFCLLLNRTIFGGAYNIITGSGGIGKTTASKIIADRFQEIKKDSSVFFIEATDPDVLNYLVRTAENKQIDLYDFYEATFESRALEKDLFRINVDNGNFLLVIDGLDEVFARIADFDINNFITSISEDFIREIGIGKVILTCRTYFWNDQISRDSNTNHFEILPFNSELAKQFFQSKFNDTVLVRKSLKIVASFNPVTSNESDKIMPYLLDVVAKLVEAGDDVQLEEIRPIPYLNLKYKNDFVVYKLFVREEKKINQISIIDQCKFFVFFSVFYEGKLSSKNIPQLWNDYFNKPISENVIQLLKSHPLLQEISGSIMFRYNFFEDYFKTLYLANFITIENTDKPSSSLIKILLSDGKFGSSLLHEVANRCEDWGSDSILRISDIIQTVSSNTFDLENEINNYKEKVVSGLFSLALTINQKKLGNTTEANTKLLTDIFEIGPSKISGIALVNLSSSGGNIKFNFSGLKFNNCYFDGYESFWECSFNQETYFENCTFLNIPYPKTKSIHEAKINNFINPRKDSTFDEFFSWEVDKIKSRGEEITLLLEKYFKLYYSNGNLQPQRIETIIHRRYNSKMQSIVRIDQLEGILKSSGIIVLHYDKVAGEDKSEITKEFKDDITKFVKEGTVSIRIKSIIDTILASLK